MRQLKPTVIVNNTQNTSSALLVYSEHMHRFTTPDLIDQNQHSLKLRTGLELKVHLWPMHLNRLPLAETCRISIKSKIFIFKYSNVFQVNTTIYAELCEPTVHMTLESKCPHLSNKSNFLRLSRSENVFLCWIPDVPAKHRHKGLELRIPLFLFFSLSTCMQAAPLQKEQE